MQDNGAQKVYKAFSAIEMSIQVHVYHGTWAVIINALIPHFLTETVLQEPHGLVTQSFQRLGKDKLKLETRFSKITRQFHQLFTAMGKVNYYVCSLKQSICEDILKGLPRMPPNVRSNLIDIKTMAAT